MAIPVISIEMPYLNHFYSLEPRPEQLKESAASDLLRAMLKQFQRKIIVALFRAATMPFREIEIHANGFLFDTNTCNSAGVRRSIGSEPDRLVAVKI